MTTSQDESPGALKTSASHCRRNEEYVNAQQNITCMSMLILLPLSREGPRLRTPRALPRTGKSEGGMTKVKRHSFIHRTSPEITIPRSPNPPRRLLLKHSNWPAMCCYCEAQVPAILAKLLSRAWVPQQLNCCHQLLKLGPLGKASLTCTTASRARFAAAEAC